MEKLKELFTKKRLPKVITNYLLSMYNDEIELEKGTIQPSIFENSKQIDIGIDKVYAGATSEIIPIIEIELTPICRAIKEKDSFKLLSFATNITEIIESYIKIIILSINKPILLKGVTDNNRDLKKATTLIKRSYNFEKNNLFAPKNTQIIKEALNIITEETKEHKFPTQDIINKDFDTNAINEFLTVGIAKTTAKKRAISLRQAIRKEIKTLLQ